MTIDIAIKHFSQFLNDSWNSITELVKDRTYTSDQDSINDWMQVNWELLVERKVLDIHCYLEVYGDGADFYGASSRITDYNSLPNYEIEVKAVEISDLLNDELIGRGSFNFVQLVSFKDGFYFTEPNFDFVLVEDDATMRVFKLNEVIFNLKKKKASGVPPQK